MALATLASLPAPARAAESAQFDLAGPRLHAEVTRGARTLPITQVPSLQAGDRIMLRADLPADQSAHYLLVVAFLRGPTNPPPSDWFFRCDTWTAPCNRRGLSLVVPTEAQQLLVFFAPQTGGDFKTLTSAIQGRPGAFVRAAQGLTQAMLDRLRLEQYLAGVQDLSAHDPARLKDVAPVLARSLAIKVEEKCLDRIPALQAPCLMQGQESLILNDGHGTSMVSTLTSGPASDLAIQAGNTPLMSSGAHLPLIGSLLDIARLLDTFHTAQYQYIPALALPRGDHLALMLNTPPSFHDPKSVLVAAIAAIEAPQPPALHAAEPDRVYCSRRNPLELATQGPPAVFATGFAHDLVLSLTDRHGAAVELPAHPDARHGGFSVDAAGLAGRELDATVTARLHGAWGFDRLEGPAFALAGPAQAALAIAPGEAPDLVIGGTRTVHLAGASLACIDEVRLRDAGGHETPLAWEAGKDRQLAVRVALESAVPGPLTLLVRQHGLEAPQEIALRAYVEPARIEALVLHAGDTGATLRGLHLEQVERVTLDGTPLVLGALATSDGKDELELGSDDAAPLRTLAAGAALHGVALLRDGRELPFRATVAVARPAATLLSQSLERTAGGTVEISLGERGEWPVDARVTFSIRTRWPGRNFRDAAIEIAATDDSFAATLSARDGSVTFQNAGVAIASFVPASAFGSSAFGPLKFRVTLDGTASDWQPLATVVRLPALRGLECPESGAGACQLSGSGLYLLEAISAGPRFTTAVRVPEGYTGSTISVPRPSGGKLYFRLRDDPRAISSASLLLPAAAAAHPAPTPGDADARSVPER
ncbi:MAG: hypothetical protein JSR73_04640 [Proteobacteria bacterium]|nr:hypothetical protein [Pseudomonadota bacterium]